TTSPAPARAVTPDAEGAQHPVLGTMLMHPMLASPADPQRQRELQATYYGMVSEVDHHVGRLLDWIDASGAADRTLVVFTADHGELLGDHWMVEKISWFASSFHVPLIVRGPGVTAGTVDAMTEHVDVLPTICELLGAEIPLQCDGRSLGPWLRREVPTRWREEVRHELDLRDPASTFLEEMFGIGLEECSLAVLRDRHGSYVQFAGDHAFPAIYFDLDADPAETRNLAADPAYAATVLGYAQRMIAWRLRHAERTLTGMKLTGHAGLVERRGDRR
ncbi:MAG: sulfatase-like hydrolase/transferase, partial [Actinomycetota bacterium]